MMKLETARSKNTPAITAYAIGVANEMKLFEIITVTLWIETENTK